jgi:hypothetical protein
MAGKNQVILTFAGDSSDLERAFSRVGTSANKMDSKIGTVGNRMSRLGQFGKTAALGLAAVGVAAVGVGVGLVNAAEESQKVTRQTDAVIKSMGLSSQVTGNQIAEMSEKISLATGVDDELIQSGQNLLLTFGSLASSAGDTGGNFDRATQAALDMSVALGTDMNSAAMQVGKALNDPIKGLSTLTRAGIQFTDAQKEQITAMVEAGDVAGAQALMLNELENQFGGSAEAQATASDKLGVAWGNLQEMLGEKLLPVVNAFSKWVIQTGIPAIESFIGWIDRNRVVLLIVAGVFAGVLVAALVAFVASLSAVTVAIVAVGAAAGVVGMFVVKHFNTMKSAVMGVFNWIRSNWPLLLAIITGPIGLAVLAVVRHWNTIKSGFTAVKNWIRDRVNDIVSFITGIPGRIAGAAKSIGTTIINGIKNGITSIGGFVGDIASSIKGAINSALHLPFTIKGPGPLPDFTIPSFHTGGTFHAPNGQREGLAMLLDGERVLRPGQSAGGGTVIVNVHGSLLTDERKLVKIIRDEIDRRGFGGRF